MVFQQENDDVNTDKMSRLYNFRGWPGMFIQFMNIFPDKVEENQGQLVKLPENFSDKDKKENFCPEGTSFSIHLDQKIVELESLGPPHGSLSDAIGQN